MDKEGNEMRIQEVALWNEYFLMRELLEIQKVIQSPHLYESKRGNTQTI